MRIKKVLLYSNDYKLKEVKLNYKGITVIIGNSKTGKSSLINIIDYCLASSSCEIPVGKIRDSCSWFGIVIEINNKTILLARESPKGRLQSDKMYFKILDNIQNLNFDCLTSNVTRDEILKYFNEYFNLTNLEINFDKNQKAYYPTYRNTIGINFFPQSLLLDQQYYFYKQNVDEHRKNLLNMFPFILGISSMQDIVYKVMISDYERKIKLYENMLEKKDESFDYWDENSQDIFLRCVKWNLLPPPIPDSLEDRVSLLENLKNKDINEIIELSKDSLDSYNSEIIKLENKCISLNTTIMTYNNKITAIKINFNAIEEFEKNSKINIEYRKISEWLLQDEYIKNNISISNSDYSLNIYKKILNMLKNEEESLNFYGSFRAQLDKELQTLTKEQDNLIIQLTSATNILKEHVIHEKNKSHKISIVNIYEFFGEIKTYLKMYKRLNDTDDFKDKIKNYKALIDEYKHKISHRNIQDREIEANKYFENLLDTILNELNVEYKNIENGHKKVKFELRNPEFKFKTTINDTSWKKLENIGSGSNHVQYHIAMAFLIHIYIQDKVTNKCNFDFLIFDQPSEAYFPTDSDDLAKKNTSESDKIIVKDMFRAISLLHRDYCPKLQVIILEHAGEAYWIDPLTNKTFNNVEIIDWKKSNDKLIPEDW